jgi:hypothetical protein
MSALPGAPAAGDAASLDGAVIVPRLGLVYAMRPAGGIDAIDLGSGRVRWPSDPAARPLTVVGERRVAQAEPAGAGSLELVVLDARNGAARSSARVPVAANVTASVVDTAAGSFRAWAEGRDSQLVLRWEHASLSASGHAQGYLPAAHEGQPPSLGGGEASFTVEGSSLRLEDVGALRSTTAEAVAPPGLTEATVAAVRESGRQFLSADGRHVLVTERVASAEFRLDHHRWILYERESGAKLGTVRAVVSATPFVVVGRTLYYTSPPHVLRREGRLARRGSMLRAVDLQSGADVWTKAVRDSAFRGPFPP